jgi:hypothetical protein
MGGRFDIFEFSVQEWDCDSSVEGILNWGDVCGQRNFTTVDRGSEETVEKRDIYDWSSKKGKV